MMALDNIWLALDIAERGNIPITLMADQLRALLEKIAELESKVQTLEYALEMCNAPYFSVSTVDSDRMVDYNDDDSRG